MICVPSSTPLSLSQMGTCKVFFPPIPTSHSRSHLNSRDISAAIPIPVGFPLEFPIPAHL